MIRHDALQGQWSVARSCVPNLVILGVYREGDDTRCVLTLDQARQVILDLEKTILIVEAKPNPFPTPEQKEGDSSQ